MFLTLFPLILVINFVASMVLSHRSVNKLWEVVVVYGLADHSISHSFLDELALKVSSSSFPATYWGRF